MKDISADRTDWTKEDYLEAHRALWRWLTEETLRRQKVAKKAQFFEAFGITKVPDCKCFLCEFSWKQWTQAKKLRRNGEYHHHHCHYCPVSWKNDPNRCITPRGDGLHTLYVNSCDYMEAAILAKQIAELPLREEASQLC